MSNEPLFYEEAELKIAEREQEAEMYGLQKRLGYSDRGYARWVFALIALVIAMVLVVGLF